MKKIFLLVSIFALLICVMISNVFATNNADISALQTFFDSYNDNLYVPIAKGIVKDIENGTAVGAYINDYVREQVIYSMNKSDLISESLYNRINSDDESIEPIILNFEFGSGFDNIIYVNIYDDNDEKILLKIIHLTYENVSQEVLGAADTFSQNIKKEYYTYDINDYLEARCLETDPVFCENITFDINNYIESDVYTIEQKGLSYGIQGATPYFIYIIKDGIVVGTKSYVNNMMKNYIYIPADTLDTVEDFVRAGQEYFDSIIPSTYDYTFTKNDDGYQLVFNTDEVFLYDIVFYFDLIKDNGNARDIVTAVNDYYNSINNTIELEYYNGKSYVELPFDYEMSNALFNTLVHINEPTSQNVRIEFIDGYSANIIGFINENGEEKTIYTRNIYFNLITRDYGDDEMLTIIENISQKLSGYREIKYTSLYNAMALGASKENAFRALTRSDLASYLNTTLQDTDVAYDIVDEKIACTNFDCETTYKILFKNGGVIYNINVVNYGMQNTITLQSNSNNISVLKKMISNETAITEGLISITGSNPYSISYDNFNYEISITNNPTQIYFEQDKLLIDNSLNSNFNLESILKMDNITFEELDLTWTVDENSVNYNYTRFDNPKSGIMTWTGSYQEKYNTIIVQDTTLDLQASIEVLVTTTTTISVINTMNSFSDTITIPFYKDLFVDSNEETRLKNILLETFTEDIPSDVIIRYFDLDLENDKLDFSLMDADGRFYLNKQLDIIYPNNSEIKTILNNIFTEDFSIYLPFSYYYNSQIAGTVMTTDELFNAVINDITKKINLDGVEFHKESNGSMEYATGISTYFKVYMIYHGIYYATFNLNVTCSNIVFLPDLSQLAVEERMHLDFPNTENISVVKNDMAFCYDINVDDQGEIAACVMSDKHIYISEITTTDTNPISMMVGDTHSFKMNFSPAYNDDGIPKLSCYTNSNKISMSDDCMKVSALNGGNNIPVRICIEGRDVCITYYLDISGTPIINFSLTPYLVTNDVIFKIPLDTTVVGLVNALGNYSGITIKDNSTNYLTGKIKTGLTLNYQNVTYTLSVKGDVRGTGEVRMVDVMKVANYILDDTSITGDAYIKAADVTGDGNIRMNDVMKMATYLVDGGSL